MLSYNQKVGLVVFHLQSYTCANHIFWAYKVLDYLKVDDIYEYLASFHYSETSLHGFLLHPLKLL